MTILLLDFSNLVTRPPPGVAPAMRELSPLPSRTGSRMRNLPGGSGSLGVGVAGGGAGSVGEGGLGSVATGVGDAVGGESLANSKAKASRLP